MACLEVEVNCFENPLQLLGIFVSLMYHFFGRQCFFFFLCTLEAVQQNKEYSKYCGMFAVVSFA